jgi:predicted tellurium resistance membrane protein TerC
MKTLIALATDTAAWIALIMLILTEVVRAMDNLIFIAILANKLPEHQRNGARKIGISAALVLRLLLLFMIAAIVQLTTPILSILGIDFSWRDLILIAGGLFLVWTATKEIRHRVHPRPAPDLFDRPTGSLGFRAAIGHILLLDLVFSVDSIFTAVRMTPHVPIIAIAVIVAVLTLLLAATPMSDFINAYPTLNLFALAFLLMIGVVLIADGFGLHVSRFFIYVAMVVSLAEGHKILVHRPGARSGDDATH